MLIFLLHILGYDVWFYISHILMHITPLWKYHKEHHKIIHPKFTDTYTGHYAESALQSLGFFLPYAFYSFELWPFLAALATVNIRGMMRHDDRTIWLIGNHHLLHHEYFNCNYGEYWLDKLFRTSIKRVDKVRKGLLYV
jgi:lathosterol oxidase